MLGITEKVKNTSLSDELFTKDNIKEWYIRWDSKQWFGNNNHYRGSVEYKNGDLSGKKQFEAQSFEELVKMMDDFIKNNQ